MKKRIIDLGKHFYQTKIQIQTWYKGLAVIQFKLNLTG